MNNEPHLIHKKFKSMFFIELSYSTDFVDNFLGFLYNAYNTSFANLNGFLLLLLRLYFTAKNKLVQSGRYKS